MMFLLIVTVTSMLLAAVMSAIAWRIALDERRRSEARVAALAAEIHDMGPDPVAGRLLSDPDGGRVPWDPPLGRVQPPTPRPWGSTEALREGGKDAVCTGLSTAQPPRSGRGVWVAVAGSVALCAAAVTIAGSGRFFHERSVSAPALAEAPVTRPLELVALGHERVGDELTVRGVIRNPSSGAGMDRLTAVVLLFTPDGGFLASGRADVDATALRPGGESTFVVTVPRAADVARYRVSFRTDERIVPHLDRRHES
jgi:hypothetical protein